MPLGCTSDAVHRLLVVDGNGLGLTFSIVRLRSTVDLGRVLAGTKYEITARQV